MELTPSHRLAFLLRTKSVDNYDEDNLKLRADEKE